MRFSSQLAAVKGLRRKKKKKTVTSKADEGATMAMVKYDLKSCGFDKLPEELLMKILARLPAKLVTRLMCVSHLWYTLISSRYFIKLFLESPSSAKRPRLLASLVDMVTQRDYVFLTSSSPHDHLDTTALSVLDKVLKMPGMGGHIVNALRGLLCLRIGASVRICNLATRQRVVLPILSSRLLAQANDNVWNFLGYDSVHDEYKVVSTVWEVSKEDERVVRSENQVFVLGAGASWRNIQSTVPPPTHCPYSPGISINNVLYYGAWVDKRICVVMSFDLASEDFNLIELPLEAGIIWHSFRANLLNYRGKLAVVEYSQHASDIGIDGNIDATINLWVMEDARNRKWSTKTMVLPFSQMNIVHGDLLAIRGTGRCNEVSLTKIKMKVYGRRPVFIYDLEKNKITRHVEISPPPHLLFFGMLNGFQIAFLEDDIENIMYLET